MTPIWTVAYIGVWVLAIIEAVGWILTHKLYKQWRTAHEELCKTIREFKMLAEDPEDEDCKMGPEHGCQHPRHKNQPEEDWRISEEDNI